MRYYEIRFRIEPDTQDVRDVVSAVCGDAGLESFDEDAGQLRGYVRAELFDRRQLDAVLAVLPFPGVNVSYEVADAPDEDWNESWENNGFEPIEIGQRCVIYDARAIADERTRTLVGQYPIAVAIDARQAFGTGTHETTRMIAGELTGMELMGKRVLDCGCGTGVLGIIAAKCGAREVTAYDIDDWSVRNACHNAQLNKVKMEVLEGDKSVLSHVSGVFDVVLANINRNILLADMEAFVSVMSADATLIMSGFYEADVPILLEKAAALELKEKGRRKQGDWMCLILGNKA